MCLLIVLAGVREDLPLVVAANRDELLARPATAMTVLRDRDPRIIGGRDEQAGGTWLAVNEHGVVAGLTNRPTAEGPDGSKRSRGELPLLCAAHPTARAAVTALASDIDPSGYNPAWLLVADRSEVFAVDVIGTAPTIDELGPGIHLLENRPFGAASPKIDHLRSLLEGVEECEEGVLLQRLRAVLANHEIPVGASAAAEAGRADVPPEVGAACVHADRYGTRWSAIVTVSKDHRVTFRVADGAPCEAPFEDASPLLTARP